VVFARKAEEGVRALTGRGQSRPRAGSKRSDGPWCDWRDWLQGLARNFGNRVRA
jgi:hypothetical protein